MDLTIELKLSSKISTSAAFLATWVPEIPMATPTFALRRAGASFVPSPVTATILFSFLRPSTSFSLCSGLLLARIFKCFTFWKNSSGVKFCYSFSNSAPSMHSPGVKSPGLVIPISSPTALAVILLSPVTMMTTTPAMLQFLIAYLLSGLRRSWIPASKRRVNPEVSRGLTPNLSLFSI